MRNSLFPYIREQLLVATLLEPERSWYMSELANKIECTPSSLQRELLKLVDIGILSTERRGTRNYYQANQNCPYLQELQSLIIKTAGVVDIIKASLSLVADEIETAFIYGSFATGEEVASSDVDLMIVGNVGLSDLSMPLREAETKLNRLVNPTVYSQEDFTSKTSSHFISSVLKEPKLYIIGSDDGVA